MMLRAAVVSPDGHRRIEAELSGPGDAPETLGRRVADYILKHKFCRADECVSDGE